MNKSLVAVVAATGALALYAVHKLRKSDDVVNKRQNVVVTGASSGIGAEIARQYARRGASLVIAARRLEELQKVAEECRQLGSPLVEVCVTDVTNPADCERAGKVVAEKFDGKLDVLVLNAGIACEGCRRVDRCQYLSEADRNKLFGMRI